MEDLRQHLQDKREWLVRNIGSFPYASITLAELDAILDALPKPTDLPKIEPRLLHPQEPRGTKRSPEEVAKRLAELYGQSEELRGKFLRTCA